METSIVDAESIATECSDTFKLFLDELPKIDADNFVFYNFEGFWYAPRHLEAAISARSNFVARDDDIILASSIKTGSTWLKTLVYCIMGPKYTDFNDDPLAKNHPSMLVSTLEVQTFVENPNPDLSRLPSPRVFHTHVPYVSLPDSIKNSECKIVYIARNPKDTFTSMWNFFKSVWEFSLEALFEGFCQGVQAFGPYFEHVLRYWNESLKAPQKIMFLKYEDLKKDPKGQVKRLASFLGKPLDDEEIERVIWRCSLERLKNLEVNKNGVVPLVEMPNI